VNELLKAFCILEREHLINNLEKAARALGIWALVQQNSTAELWRMAHAGAEPDPNAKSMEGSEPVVMIETEPNPDFVPAPPPSPVRVKSIHSKKATK
jgi:hypothetical protein